MSSSTEVPPLAEGHMVDLIHHYSYSIVHECWEDEEALAEHYQALQYFCRQVGDTPEFGRLANRVKLAEVTFATLRQDAYQWKHDDNNNNNNDDDNTKPLVAWNRHDWERLDQILQAAQQSLIRMDANSTVHGPHDERPLRHVDRANSPLYNKTFTRIRDQILLHQALSPIRELLERDVHDEHWDLPSIGQSSLQELRDYVDDMDDNKAKRFLNLLVLKDDDTGLVILDNRDIQGTCRSKPLCLTDFQAQIVQLVKNWSDDVFSLGRPPLTEFYQRDLVTLDDQQQEQQQHHHQEDEENQPPPVVRMKTEEDELEFVNDDDNHNHDRAKSRRLVKTLRRNTENLTKDVVDPIDEAVDIANGAPTRTGPFLTRPDGTSGGDPTHSRKRGGRITRQQQLAKASSTPERTRRQSVSSDEEVSEPAAKKKRRRSNDNRRSKRSNLSGKPKSGRREAFNDSDGEEEEENVQRVHLSAVPTGLRVSVPQRKRRFFSADEKQALREGITVHGVGQWKLILDDHRGTFRGRNSVNLKDLYRTMMKNGEL